VWGTPCLLPPCGGGCVGGNRARRSDPLPQPPPARGGGFPRLPSQATGVNFEPAASNHPQTISVAPYSGVKPFLPYPEPPTANQLLINANAYPFAEKSTVARAVDQAARSLARRITARRCGGLRCVQASPIHSSSPATTPAIRYSGGTLLPHYHDPA